MDLLHTKLLFCIQSLSLQDTYYLNVQFRTRETLAFMCSNQYILCLNQKLLLNYWLKLFNLALFSNKSFSASIFSKIYFRNKKLPMFISINS
jgi:hypothetical protein